MGIDITKQQEAARGLKAIIVSSFVIVVLAGLTKLWRWLNTPWWMEKKNWR